MPGDAEDAADLCEHCPEWSRADCAVCPVDHRPCSGWVLRVFKPLPQHEG